jgi:ATP-dependent DNA helicase RecG
LLLLSSRQDYYRNLFLERAMVMNMIETIGNGIPKNHSKGLVFSHAYYGISDEIHTKVTVHGELINENYTHQLYVHPELTLEDVIAFDKVQKRQGISTNTLNRLRSLMMVKERSTSLEITGTEKPDGLTNKDYKRMILNLLAEKGSATKGKIETLLLPLLPADLPIVKKQKNIKSDYRVTISRDENKECIFAEKICRLANCRIKRFTGKVIKQQK